MADNTLLNSGTGGNTVRTLDDGTDQWPAGVLAYPTTIAAGANVIQLVDLTHGVPVQPQTSSTWAATQSGTWNIGTLTTITNVVHVDDNAGSLTVDNAGTFAVQAAQSGTWNITNISGTVSLPTGAATAAKQPALGTAGTASADVITIQGIASMTAVKVDGSAVTQPVSGTFWQATQPVSAASLPLPSGASTAAKQPALGTAGAASTDVITVQGIASMTALKVDGSAVTQPVSGTVSITANSAVNVAQLAGTTTDTNSGLKSAGTLRVVLATDQPALTNKLLVTPDPITFASAQAVTQSGTWTIQPGNTANTTPWLVTDTPATSGGLSFSHVTSAASNNKTQVKATAGQVFMISAQNSNASIRYLKVFNNTSAGVTMGTTAADYQFMIPGNTAGAGLVLNIDKGLAHSTGITIAITGGVSLTDNTAISANDVTLTIGYK